MEKLQIELNNHPCHENMIYAAVSFRGGYITHDYIINGSHFESNYAFYNVLFNYLRLTNENEGFHYDVQRATSTISFYRQKENFSETLSNALHILFNHEYISDIFDEAKKNTRDAFAQNYKNGAFRAKYKGYEFSDLNKHFVLKNLINDIENITFEDFTRIAGSIVVPGNACVYILGDTEGLDFSDALQKDDAGDGASVRIAGYEYDPYLRQNAYVVNKAREDHNLIIEVFDFFNDDCTNFTKFIITELLAEEIKVPEIDVWVDSLDSSVMFTSEKLCDYKGTLKICDENSYYEAQKSLMTKYMLLIENQPESFVIKASSMMSIGIYIDQYLEALDKCSYELFAEICEKADYRITEAQVVLRKELT